MALDDTVEDHKARYHKARHALHSGVVYLTDAKHMKADNIGLRVSINTLIVELKTTIRIMIDFGILSESSYYKRLADEMEEEVERYELQIEMITGKDTKLH